MSEFFDLQVDLETMGGPPDGAIVGLGAAFFDLQTCKLGPTFYRGVHLATSMRAGMRVDASTILFWLRQGDAARAAISMNLTQLEVALVEFAIWILATCRHEDVRVWGNGASFDLTILRHAYRLCKLDQPWRFNKERCFRTVRNMYPDVVYDVNDKPGTAHNAVDDAVFQAQHLFKIKNRNQRKATP